LSKVGLIAIQAMQTKAPGAAEVELPVGHNREEGYEDVQEETAEQGALNLKNGQSNFTLDRLKSVFSKAVSRLQSKVNALSAE